MANAAVVIPRENGPFPCTWIAPTTRFLWREIVPFVERAEKAQFKRFLLVLLRNLLPYQHSSACAAPSIDPSLVLCRRLRSRTSDSGESIVLWLRPPTTELVERSFTARLLRWEHDLIRAQTYAGFFATLGGGYFMCHHWTTAVKLAQQQQYMASLLGDTGMFYKCLLNQAYNYIYASKFARAHRIIVAVYHAVKQQARPDIVLLKMCISANTFRRRVRNAQLTGDCASTIDDFARIRLVRDQSTPDDSLPV